MEEDCQKRCKTTYFFNCKRIYFILWL